MQIWYLRIVLSCKWKPNVVTFSGHVVSRLHYGWAAHSQSVVSWRISYPFLDKRFIVTVRIIFMCCVKLIMSLLGFIVFGVGTFVVSIYAALLVVRDCNAMMKRFVNLFNVKVFFILVSWWFFVCILSLHKNSVKQLIHDHLSETYFCKVGFFCMITHSHIVYIVPLYSVSQKKSPPLKFSDIFSQMIRKF